MTELREGIKTVREDLAENFTDLDREEKYGKQMWAFAMMANSRLEDLADDVTNADATFAEVIRYYGEEDNKSITSSEFYGIFKTFVTSYRVGLDLRASHARALLTMRQKQKCRMDNQTVEDDKLAVQKRKQAAEDMKATREKRNAAQEENTDVLDHLLEELRNGKSVTRKARRTRPSANSEVSTAPSAGDPVDAAAALLAEMQGLDSFMPQHTSTIPTRRRRRRKPSENDFSDFGVIPGSPLSSEADTMMNETLFSETDDDYHEDGERTIRYSSHQRQGS